ncbi:hypothetical protein QE450_003862 [Paenibacillus sp. SORGH_AS306]|nr:hypothetical protein [Paenibacillus sp. SORGH_AS_0306]MDR6108718.1 hypothetical protein [Paenibacillus sp. SORGH_AS_0338]
MSELLDPKNDFLFKHIFGSKKNKDVLLRQSISELVIIS